MLLRLCCALRFALCLHVVVVLLYCGSIQRCEQLEAEITFQKHLELWFEGLLETMKRPAACKAAQAKPRSLATMKRPAACPAAKAKPRSPASKIDLPRTGVGLLTALKPFLVNEPRWDHYPNRRDSRITICSPQLFESEDNVWGSIWVNFENKRFNLIVTANHTIEHVKFEIFDRFGIPSNEQHHCYTHHPATRRPKRRGPFIEIPLEENMLFVRHLFCRDGMILKHGFVFKLVVTKLASNATPSVKRQEECEDRSDQCRGSKEVSSLQANVGRQPCCDKTGCTPSGGGDSNELHCGVSFSRSLNLAEHAALQMLFRKNDRASP